MELIEFIVKEGAPAGGAGIMQFIPFIFIFGIMYFLIIRPQSKQRKLHQEMMKKLSKGDEVITSSGIYGDIFAVDEKFVILKIAEKTKIKVLKSYITTNLSAINQQQK